MTNIPLFWCLTAQAQAKLMQYQYDTYGYKLTIPGPPKAMYGEHYEIEPLEDIDRLMRQAPSRSRGKNG